MRSHIAKGGPTLAGHQVALSDGRVLNLVELIGNGDHAAVYRAELTCEWGIVRQVAVKLFHARATDESQHIFDQLTFLARDIARVQHPNVVPIYEFGLLGNQPFVVQECVQGSSLSAVITEVRNRNERLPIDFCLYVATSAARGLKAALQLSQTNDPRSCVHGDLSARQILISLRGEIKVSDFGFARIRAASSHVRGTRQLAARAVHLSPEVATGETADACSDVFSLGIILYELLIGERFPRSTNPREIPLLLTKAVISAPLFEPQLPEALRAVVRRATHPERGERYPSAIEMERDLTAIALAMGAADTATVVEKRLRDAVNRPRPSMMASVRSAMFEQPEPAASVDSDPTIRIGPAETGSL